MAYPAEHFPGTPLWAQAAVSEAIRVTGVTASKWQVPLEAIGRYESNWNNNANLCSDPALNLPLAAFQLARNMYAAANKDFKLLVPLPSRKHDPECSAIVTVLYINSKLEGYGGYQGIGELTGTKGLLPRTDRGPGNVLRRWVADPLAFDVEEAREDYRGY